ncbi:MAG: type transport system ATP-binding protein [Actinomycetota bacterium]|nr:type transport system ATP-binding protein [Actinomycetota bacterium]
MDETSIISVEDLRRRYGKVGAGGFDAVRGVSFSVRRGELFAVLGTNGAGKTSTLDVLEGLALPTSGAVRVLGHDPYHSRRLVRPRVGIMLQDGGLPPDLTVNETARMWAGTLTSARPVEEALDLVDLRHRAKVTVNQLSGGERRRLDLAMAVIGRPEILFLDEPTAGLDPESRQRTWRLVRDLLGSGTTVVLTTHYLQEAEELADRLAILHQGRIVRAGTPAEVTASQPAQVSFTLTADPPDPVPDLPGALGVDRAFGPGGSKMIVRTRDLQRTLGALLAWAGSRGLVLADLNARSASLEEAFLAVADAAGDRADPEVAA